MTEKQKQAILVLNKAKEYGVMSEEDYLLLMEFIMETQRPTQYVPYPVEVPSSPSVLKPWEGPWVGYQTTSTTNQKPSYDK